MITGSSPIPDDAKIPEGLRSRLVDDAAQNDMQELEEEELAELWSKLRSRFEAGPGISASEFNTNGHEPEETEEKDEELSSVPIPSEYLLEDLSRELRLNPLSLFSKLKQAIQVEGWRSLPEEKQLWADRVSVMVLRLLGHCWLKQIEAGEPAADWADPDGIIPHTPLANESTLFERVHARLRADEINLGDFAEVMDKPLDAWLATEFFKHLTKQFKKRPIAWQLQSGKFTAHSSPAFACLVYYHKLDADTLPKIRSQYVGPLRQRLETELRGVASIAPEARSDRQAARRSELEDSIVELQKFDAALAGVAAAGFGPKPQLPGLRQFAIDDAMLALKARWLRRLTELVVTSVLSDWLDAAAESSLHEDFGSWVSDATSHLDHHCAQVGPKPPDQKQFPSDPTAPQLAALVHVEADAMLAGALSLACDVWWNRLDDAVFAPFKQEIKGLKEEQKQHEESLRADPPSLPAEVRELKARVKEIKAEVKRLNSDLADKVDRAKAIRHRIEAWRSSEPLAWEDWLAGQPLFDQISSLDERRPPPATIAEFVAQESLYAPDINDGVRVNIAPLQKAGLLAADVLASGDLNKAIADRAEWRSDERRWVREGKLPQPGWWLVQSEGTVP